MQMIFLLILQYSREQRACSPDQTLSPSPPPLGLPATRWPPSRTLYGTGCVCPTGWRGAPLSCGRGRFSIKMVQGEKHDMYRDLMQSFRLLSMKSVTVC